MGTVLGLMNISLNWQLIDEIETMQIVKLKYETKLIDSVEVFMLSMKFILC